MKVSGGTGLYLLKMLLLAGVSTTPTLAFGQDSQGLTEIVVTAQKREQNLQDVPISITALTADTLAANRIENVRDLSALAPNFTVRPAPGGTAGPSYSMRGIVSLATAPGSDKGISLYLDGVYVGHTSGSIFELADIERIEVLKGPQGTLFGRNSTGGAISIVTKEPTGEFAVRQDLTYGNYDHFRAKTRVDLPQFGPLSLAVNYLHSQRRGDIKNLGAGSTWDYSSATNGKWGILKSPKYMGDQNIDSVAVAAKLDLHPDVDLRYKFDWSENNFSADGQGVMGLNFSALGPVMGNMLDATLAAQPNPELMTPVTSKRPKAVNNDFTTRSFIKNVGHNFTGIWRANDSIILKNILAFRKSEVRAGALLDGLGGLINTEANGLGPVGGRLVLVAAPSQTNEKQWSNETQLNVSTDLFDLTAGYLHYDGFTKKGAPEGAPATLQFRVLQNGIIPFNGSQRATAKTISNALYLQNELHVNEQLDVVLGGRMTWDRKRGLDTSVPGYYNFKYKGSKATWLAGVNYKPTDDVMAYLKWSTGYISGGYFASLDFDPETAKSWEAGVKADLFDKRLRANLALFHAKYTGLQFIASGTSAGVPGVPQVILNGGAARAQGFEFDMTVVPVNGVTLGGNIGHTDFKYTEVNPAVGTLDTFKPVYRPRWTAGSWLQYDNRDIVPGARLLIRADGNFKSKAYNIVTVPTPAMLAATTTNAYWIVNGRIALADIEIGRSTVDVALWGRNLFNDKSLAWASNLSFIYAGSYERARTYGVDVSFRF